MTDARDSVSVFIRDCRIKLRTGIHPHEMDGPQLVIVNVELEAGTSHRFGDKEEKSLDRVIDYQAPYRFITEELPQMGHIYLLESAADAIAAFCLNDARVRRARVRIEKTDVFADAAGAGVEIIRCRASAP